LCSPPSLQEHHRPCPLTTQALAAVAVRWGCDARPPLRPLAVVSARRCWRHLLGCRPPAWHASVARCLGPPPGQPSALLACCLAGERKPVAAQAHPASLSSTAPPHSLDAGAAQPPAGDGARSRGLPAAPACRARRPLTSRPPDAFLPASGRYPLSVRYRAMELRRGRTKELRRGHARSTTGQAKTQDLPPAAQDPSTAAQ
jgi:hypothetical protein